jgi:hypothetical protein
VRSVLTGELNIGLHILDTLLLHGDQHQPSPRVQAAFARALKVQPLHFLQCFRSVFIWYGSGSDPDPGFWWPKNISVADPGCLSRILIFTHPGSRIQKQQQKRGVKKIFCHTFLCTHKFHKIENYLSFEVLKKKNWANFQRIIELFTQKIVTKFSKIGFGIRDPGSGKNLFRIPDPGVKKAPDPGSGSATKPKIEIYNWKTTIYLSLGLHTSKLQKMPSALKTWNFLIFSLFVGLKCWMFFFEGWRLLGSRIRNPLFGSKDPGWSYDVTDPDSVEHWFILSVSNLFQKLAFI